MGRYVANTGAVDLGFYGWMNRLMLWLIGLAVAGLIVLKYVPLIQKNADLRRQVGQLERRVRLLEMQHSANAAETARLQSDPRAVEREARERLGKAKPGEWVVTF